MTLKPPAHHEFTVGAQRQEIMLCDGTRVTLLPVFDRGEPCRFMRAVALPTETILIDLRNLVRQLGADLPPAPARDVPGIVFFTLRHHYASAELLLRQIVVFGTRLDPQGTI